MAFWITILLSAAIIAIVSLGLFLQIRSGQLNVGMAVFFGIGGYATSVLCLRFGWHPAVAIPASVVVGIVLGGLFSAITLNLHHWFFAVSTLTLSVAAVTGIGKIDFIGGALGLVGVPIVTAAWPIVLSLALAIAAAVWVDRSWLGLLVRATGDDQVLAQVFGVHVKRLRVAVFALGCGLAALAGALHAHRFGVFQPNDLGFHNSLLFFVVVIVGGKTHVAGPLLGTVFLFVLPELIHITAETELIVFGGLMVLVAVAFPAGLAGAIQGLLGRTGRLRRGLVS
ncbi:MAG: branched-chain amino acid ABC transporter permease [Candidatus Lambdaproteobacteria bacterium]|nr:branched-chain amino acid ABC transporter permease [Candidatus Lambdaproteobacteria bacterium]